MGLLSDFQSLINEHGSSSILKERLSLLQDKIRVIEEENAGLKSKYDEAVKKISELTSELKKRPTPEEFVEYKGGLFKRSKRGGFTAEVRCPKCRFAMGYFEGTNEFHCDNCRLQTQFFGAKLEKVISEIED